MNFDFQEARNLMVENQLRPNKIKNPIILNLFKNTKKEDFLSDNKKLTSYSDLDINLVENRGYLKNLHIAQLILNAKIQKNQTVLHLGGLTGYVSSMLASLCKELVVIENQKNLITKLMENIKYLDIKNTTIINTEFKNGFLKKSPYDLIFIDNPVYQITKSLKDQLSSNSGKIIMIKKLNNFISKAYKVSKNKNNYTNEYLFDVFTKYELYSNDVEFKF